MEVPPLNICRKKELTNNKIYEFNEKLREYITQENTENIFSPYDFKQSNNKTATIMTHSSSTPIDYIITDYYQTVTVADTILKADHFAIITVLKSAMLKSITVKTKLSIKKTIQPQHSKILLKIQTGDTMAVQ